jgi:hypothetical protein
MEELELSIERDNPDAKYLFNYSLKNKKSDKNYETLAVLINYCPKEKAIVKVFPCVYNQKKLFDFKANKYLSYFSKSKNKDKIKSLSNYFYDFSLFLESLYKNIDSIESLSNEERDLLYYYLKINVLEITPPDLYKKYMNKIMSKFIKKGLYSYLEKKKKCFIK